MSSALITILLIFLVAVIMEIIDSSLGMMYGTILSPALIGAGYDPIVVVPSVLVSQAVGGVFGTVFHQQCRNADFRGMSRDMKVVLSMVIPGSFAVVIGITAGIMIPAVYVKGYIAVLVMIMSILCLTTIRFKFSWWKQYLIGLIAAFNKALSGGGFGPVTSTGSIVAGLDSKTSVAITTMSEVFICSLAFAGYVLFSGKLDLTLMASLTAGAILGGCIGPYIASRMDQKRLRILVGILGVISGLWLIARLIMN